MWYNYGTKTGLLLHISTGNTFKELSAKVRKIFEIQCSFGDLISIYLVVPCVPSIPSTRLLSELHHFEKHRQVSECRYGSTGCISARWVCNDGDCCHSWDGCRGDNCPRSFSSLRRWVEPRRASSMMVEMEVSYKDAYGLRIGNYHYFVEQCYLFITHVVQFNRPPSCATSL